MLQKNAVQVVVDRVVIPLAERVGANTSAILGAGARASDAVSSAG